MNKIPENLSTNPMKKNTLMNQGASQVSAMTKYNNDRDALVDLLMEQHMLETLERFKWKNLPPELPQDIIERILYFRGKGAFFKHDETHYFLPFTLEGGIDAYGRYKRIVPVNFTGSFATKETSDTFFLPESVTGHNHVVAYSKGLKVENPAIILTDRSLAISQNITPHYVKVRVLIERLVNTLIMIEINNINGVQTYSLFVEDEAQKLAVEQEFQNFDDRILQGKRVTVIVKSNIGTKPFEELTQAKNISDSQRYWQSFTSWNNLRKSIIGIANGGQHLKMEHATEQETELSSESSSAIMNNALRMREDARDLFNEYYPGFNVEVEEMETKEEIITAEKGAQTKQLEGDERE